MAKHAQSIDRKVKNRILGHGRGWVFTPSHFLDLGSRTAVSSALQRLRKSEVIRQPARGLYDYPIDHPVFGRVAPSADAVAKALANRDAVRLQPAGAYAANILGLSEQVPSQLVFLTDGPSRRVRIGQREIVLKQTTPRNMTTAGRITGTMIQALRYLGQERVNDKTLSILRRHVTNDNREQLRKDARYAPTWVAKILRQLAEET